MPWEGPASRPFQFLGLPEFPGPWLLPPSLQPTLPHSGIASPASIFLLQSFCDNTEPWRISPKQDQLVSKVSAPLPQNNIFKGHKDQKIDIFSRAFFSLSQISPLYQLPLAVKHSIPKGRDVNSCLLSHDFSDQEFGRNLTGSFDSGSEVAFKWPQGPCHFKAWQGAEELPPVLGRIQLQWALTRPPWFLATGQLTNSQLFHHD